MPIVMPSGIEIYAATIGFIMVIGGVGISLLAGLKEPASVRQALAGFALTAFGLLLMWASI